MFTKSNIIIEIKEDKIGQLFFSISNFVCIITQLFKYMRFMLSFFFFLSQYFSILKKDSYYYYRTLVIFPPTAEYRKAVTRLSGNSQNIDSSNYIFLKALFELIIVPKLNSYFHKNKISIIIGFI